MKTIQYTIRGIPEHMDATLRRMARKEGASLNITLLNFLRRGLGLVNEPARHHDLDDLAGTWVEDPEFDRAIRDMDRVDEGLWK